jgi:lipopolysaccharide/colanic/teichoic acid biosynthesis glycosyltransferase
MDIALSLGLIITVYSWLGSAIALAILLTSRGPIYFRQDRTGYRGKVFRMLKFRTMHPNKVSDLLQATNDDPRITKVGLFLRKSGLDELPQLFNVLKGDMSLVGPRPFMLYHTQLYSSKVENFQDRLMVKPGLTGWAQVNGLRGEITFDYMLRRWVSLDLSYVNKRSLYFNLIILLRTAVILFQKPKSDDYQSKLTQLLSQRAQSYSMDPNREELVVLKTLSYYDIFNFPLTHEEIERSLIGEELGDISGHLKSLVDKNIVFEESGYFSLKNEPRMVSERVLNEQRADKYLRKAPFFVRIIRSFPFTRAVFISGSLSKGAVPKDGDIDYFIISAKGRLWLNRTLLVLFKKIFLFNSKKYFCVNYFISEDQLEIPDKNLFTATEIAHLLPVYNDEVCKRFMEANNWYKDYLPQFERKLLIEVDNGKPKLKMRLENFLSGVLGERMDNYFYRLTLSQWRKKFHHMTDEEFELALRSKKGVSKHHPGNHQQAVLTELETRMEQFKAAEPSLHVA